MYLNLVTGFNYSVQKLMVTRFLMLAHLFLCKTTIAKAERENSLQHKMRMIHFTVQYGTMIIYNFRDIYITTLPMIVYV